MRLFSSVLIQCNLELQVITIYLAAASAG